MYIDFALVSDPLPPVRVRSLRFISIDATDENHRPLTGRGFRAIVEPKPALQRVDVLDT